MSNGKMKFDFWNAFNSIGVSIYPHMTDSYCCQLLAFLLVYGGENEKVVKDVALNVDMLIAQQRLNIYGGEIPNAELVGLMRRYIKELREGGEQIEWLQEIYKRYNLKHK